VLKKKGKSRVLGTSGKNRDDETSYEVRSRDADACEGATGRLTPGRFPSGLRDAVQEKDTEKPWPGCRWLLFW